VAVAQDLADLHQRRASAAHGRGGGVPQPVGTHAGSPARSHARTTTALTAELDSAA
jgi:hypothetical protein